MCHPACFLRPRRFQPNHWRPDTHGDKSAKPRPPQRSLPLLQGYVRPQTPKPGKPANQGQTRQTRDGKPGQTRYRVNQGPNQGQSPVSRFNRAGKLGKLVTVPGLQGTTIVFWASLPPAHPGASLRIKKAVITAAGQSQRALPLQTLIDRDGQEKPVLSILIEQALAANIEEICVVVWPGDETRYADAAGRHASAVRFVPQPAPKGYGDAILCAREFTGADAFLHMVGDHLYVSAGPRSEERRVGKECRSR